MYLANSASDPCHFRCCNKLISRFYWTAELGIVNTRKICDHTFHFRSHNYHHSSNLPHGLKDKYTRHNRFCREMSLEKWLIDSYILETFSFSFFYLNYPVYKKKWISVGQIFQYLMNIIHLPFILSIC